MLLDITVVYKIFLFWFIFYITPGPVWVAVMEATRRQDWHGVFSFFVRIFLPVNILIQVSQAVISVVFINAVIGIFVEIGLVFYFLGGSYIFYLAYKVLKSSQQHTSLELTFANLLMVMLLSPKIWLLFPSGAAIAHNLSDSLLINATFFAGLMFLISSLLFFFYVLIGKVGAKILQDNFSYLVFVLLTGFGMFLFIEGFNAVSSW